MKILNHIGKLIVTIGVLSIFREDEGFWGFGGYVDNTWEIVAVSLLLTIVGAFLVFFTKQHIDKKKES